jgi:hypothetical protein
MKYALTIVFGIVAVFIFGCGASKAQILKKATETVMERAAFDMECEEISTKLFGDVTIQSELMAEMNIGASGCGKRATYITRCSPASMGGGVACTPHLNSITNNTSENNKSNESD